MIAVLGAGPHGRQIAHDLKTDRLYDDKLPGYEPTICGAQWHRWVVGAVWPDVRRQIVEHVAGQAVEPHLDGFVRFPHTFVGIEVEIGAHVHILPGANVSHGVKLGDFSTIATGANVCGEAIIGEGAFIGAGATIIHGGIVVGAGALIGAGVTVRHDVAPGTVVK